MFAEQTGEPMSYIALEAPVDGFAPFVNALHEEGYAGMNVTLPFKRDAWKLAEKRSRRAELAGAVNTLIRTASKAEALADDFAELGPVTGSGLEGPFERQYDIIINGTAASIEGKVPPLPDDILCGGGACYDMMYAKDGKTAFVEWGEAHGAGISCDGLGMLVEQAAESFYLWRDIRPGTRNVLKVLRS